MIAQYIIYAKGGGFRGFIDSVMLFFELCIHRGMEGFI